MTTQDHTRTTMAMPEPRDSRVTDHQPAHGASSPANDGGRNGDTDGINPTPTRACARAREGRWLPYVSRTTHTETAPEPAVGQRVRFARSHREGIVVDLDDDGHPFIYLRDGTVPNLLRYVLECWVESPPVVDPEWRPYAEDERPELGDRVCVVGGLGLGVVVGIDDDGDPLCLFPGFNPDAPKPRAVYRRQAHVFKAPPQVLAIGTVPPVPEADPRHAPPPQPPPALFHVKSGDHVEVPGHGLGVATAVPKHVGIRIEVRPGPKAPNDSIAEALAAARAKPGARHMHDAVAICRNVLKYDELTAEATAKVGVLTVLAALEQHEAGKRERAARPVAIGFLGQEDQPLSDEDLAEIARSDRLGGGEAAETTVRRLMATIRRDRERLDGRDKDLENVRCELGAREDETTLQAAQRVCGEVASKQRVIDETAKMLGARPDEAISCGADLARCRDRDG